MLEELTTTELYSEIARHKGVFPDRERWDNWIFEYACQTATYEHHDPTQKYLDEIIKTKLLAICLATQHCYYSFPELIFTVPCPSENVIPGIVRHEHIEGDRCENIGVEIHTN